MSQNSLILAQLVALMVTASSAAHAANRSVDAAQFDVAGVTTGMSAAQAIEAASRHLRVPRKALHFQKSPVADPVTRVKQNQSFTVDADKARVTVYFEPKVPFDRRNPMVVDRIVYEMPWSPENADSMKRMAVEKYDEPSNGVVGVTTEWCLRPHVNAGFACNGFDGAVLTLSGTKIEINDPRYKEKVAQYVRQVQRAKPRF